MPGRGRKRISAAEANRKKLKCKQGHVQKWQEAPRSNRAHNLERYCGQCARDKNRRSIYGISAEGYIKLKAEFPVCAICGKDGSDCGQGSLEIDHDHKTLEVRGLLCRKCNVFLGWYENHKSLIPEMERYLSGGSA